jgi:hypothetical protein
MAKIKVTVKSIPVLYSGKDFAPGQEVEIDSKHFDENLFEKEEEGEVQEDNK